MPFASFNAVSIDMLIYKALQTKKQNPKAY